MSEAKSNNFKWYIAYVAIKSEDNMLKKVQDVCEKLFGEDYKNHIEKLEVLKSKFSTVKDGEVKEVERVAYPGYLLMRLNMTHSLKMQLLGIHGVRSFLSNAKGEPQAMSESEYQQMLKSVDKISTRNTSKSGFQIGDVVTIKEGSFQDFDGIVSEINHENKTLHLKIFVFGKEVELNIGFSGVERK